MKHWMLWILAVVGLACACQKELSEEALQKLRVVEANSVPTDLKNPAGVQQTPSGLKYRVLREGRGGATPRPESQVTVHYTGWLENGVVFDSSVKRGVPATFPLGSVIAGWTEGVATMSVGQKNRFWIPAKLAYGDGGRPPTIPPGATLVFDVELLSFQ